MVIVFAVPFEEESLYYMIVFRLGGVRDVPFVEQMVQNKVVSQGQKQ